MAIGSGATVREAFIAESTFGTTPATPTFQVFRHTGGGLRLNKGTGRSDEINADRNVRAEYQLSHDVEGSLPFEFSDATLETFIAAVLGGSWSTDALIVGNAIPSFTFEKTIDVGGGSFSYQRYKGCSIDRMSVSLGSRSAMTGSVDIVGQVMEDTATAIITGATYTAANQEAIYTADTAASLSVVGLTPIVADLSLQFSNNLRRRPYLGSLYTHSFGVGQFDLTGTVRAYYENGDLLQAIKDHDVGEISFTIGATAGKKLTFHISSAQLLNGGNDAGGKDGDEMVSFDFRGIYNAGDASSIIITRNV